jgi:hypothetical protein
MVYFKQYFLLVGERPVCVFLLISVEVSVTGRYDCESDSVCLRTLYKISIEMFHC